MLSVDKRDKKIWIKIKEFKGANISRSVIYRGKINFYPFDNEAIC